MVRRIQCTVVFLEGHYNIEIKGKRKYANKSYGNCKKYIFEVSWYTVWCVQHRNSQHAWSWIF
jgi:hypothetical protein